MRQHDSLLAAVIASPEDDAVRLVFADWLDENGESERAEFIRLQCRLATLESDDLERLHLEARQWSLLEQHRDAWQHALPAWARRLDCTFRRGFVAEAHLTLKQLVGKLPSLRRRAPLEGVEVRDWSDVPALAACPHLRGLTGFRFRGGWHWYSEGGGGITPQKVRRLVESPHLNSLNELDLHECPIQTDGAKALASSPSLVHLKSLTLNSCGLSPEGLTALGKAGFARHLTRLDLSCNFFRDEGLAALSDCSAFEQLRSLDLSANTITDEGLSSLGHASFLPGLRHLDLGSGHFGGAGLEGLFAPGRLASLRILNLDCCKISGDGPRCIADARLKELRTLIISNAELVDADAEALASAKHLTNLHTLNLWANHISDDGVKALAQSTHLPSLKDLTLGSNPEITDDGARALADSPLAERLVRLGFWRTGISRGGKQLLKERFGDRVIL